MCTIATAKVQPNYNCYNGYFNGCLHYTLFMKRLAVKCGVGVERM